MSICRVWPTRGIFLTDEWTKSERALQSCHSDQTVMSLTTGTISVSHRIFPTATTLKPFGVSVSFLGKLPPNLIAHDIVREPPCHAVMTSLNFLPFQPVQISVSIPEEYTSFIIPLAVVQPEFDETVSISDYDCMVRIFASSISTCLTTTEPHRMKSTMLQSPSSRYRRNLTITTAISGLASPNVSRIGSYMWLLTPTASIGIGAATPFGSRSRRRIRIFPQVIGLRGTRRSQWKDHLSALGSTLREPPKTQNLTMTSRNVKKQSIGPGC